MEDTKERYHREMAQLYRRQVLGEQATVQIRRLRKAKNTQRDHISGD